MLNNKLAIFQLYHNENMLNVDDDDIHTVLDQHA
jgi:hypothetical protein